MHCAPVEDPGMLVGIARQESGLEPMTLRDNASGEVLRGAGVVETARRLIAAGHSVDLGAWQINNRNLALLGLGIADAFDPCKSVAAAARLIELLSRYNTGSRSRGIANGYAAAVMAAIHAVKAASRAMPAMAPLSTSAPDPFARPSRTSRDLVFTTAGE
jgi:type IV secretion system protein VirB1